MTEPQVTEAIGRLSRFAGDDKHWQLVWANGAEMKADVLSVLAMLAARPPVSEDAARLDDVERVASGLYDHWRHEEDVLNEYCEWRLLADKETWRGRARAAIAALSTIDTVNHE